MKRKSYIRTKLFAFFLSLCTVFALAGCEDKDAQSSPLIFEEEVHDDVSLDIVLTKYSDNTESFFLSEGGFKERFEKDFPYITLNIKILPWEELFTDIEKRLIVSDAPDILCTDVFSSYVERGLLLPLDYYIDPAVKSRILPGYAEEYGIASLASVRALFCNQDILNSAGVNTIPTAREELIDACNRVKSVNPAGFPAGIDISDANGQDTYAVYAYGNGGDFADESGGPATTSVQATETLSTLKELSDAGLIATYRQNDGTIKRHFKEGLLCGIAAPQTFISECQGMNISIHSAVTTSENASNAAVCDYLCVFNNSYSADELDAISKFFSFFYETSNYSLYSGMEGLSPVSIDALDHILSNETGYRADFAGLMLGSRPYPINALNWQDLRLSAIFALQGALP